MSRTLLLVGGGHAHVAVLADWIRHGVPAGARGILLTPERHLRYSGMVPGWMAGQPRWMMAWSISLRWRRGPGWNG